ncbi:MAG: hypothetical protein A2085_03650 [Gemmatimonadetes bacterium GWC2_71_10]|nr:MAG: hypothetical protein A2085_03650 [Gemmatimonadetes bacterium GWC2_71_10]
MKTQQLQIRVSPHQKAALRRLAAAADLDVSAYVLSRALPPATDRFAGVLEALHESEEPSYALAELSDLLAGWGAGEFVEGTGRADTGGLSPLVGNYVAAMVEQAAHLKGVTVPPWTRQVAPLERPWFATSMRAVRLHLLGAAPVPYKRRNLFVDAGIGARV